MLKKAGILLVVVVVLSVLAGCEAGSKGMIDVLNSAGFEKALMRQVPVTIEQPINVTITIEGDGGGGIDVDTDEDADVFEERDLK